MTVHLSPIVSEFETEADAASYDQWFRNKVRDSLDDESATISHNDVMVEIESVIAGNENRTNSRNK